MYSVILTELGISVLNDGQIDKAFPFSNAVKEYLAVKNKESKLNELINYLAKIQRSVSVSDESLLAILKKFSIDCYIMDAEELEKIQITKPQIIVDSGFASNLQDTLGKLREFALGFSSSKVTEVSQSPDLHIIQAINSLDEIDKIAGQGGGSSPDVSREGVQRDILPIIEGSTVSTKYGQVRTDHILFIAAGAFHVSKPSDLIPELQGRFPIRVELDNLTQSDFVKILTKPKNALLKQYGALLQAEGVTLEFNKDAINEIAKIATELNETMENIGARRLHTVMTSLLEDILFDLPDKKITKISINRKTVQKKLSNLSEDEDLRRYIL